MDGNGVAQGRSSAPGEAQADAALATLLPPLVHEASVAVLVVDLTRREVTFANDLARQLAPNRDLPMTVDEWSQAAGLEDVTGADLPEGPGESTSPAESLLRVAQGTPVTGEAITAMRATAATDAREALWVLGLPLEGAPGALASLALVVFLPARNANLIAGVQESAVTLRDRAVDATRMSFTITDPTQPDNPLVWVNPAFTETTGYTFEEAVGHNCRFLQGEHTDGTVVAMIRESLEAEKACTTTLLNYRKDGRTFWNELSISPVKDASGTVTHFVGVQADVTARVDAQQARDDALSQVAHAADRLALLADFTSRMAMSQQPQHILQLLADVLVPRVGTWCALYTLDPTGRPTRPHVLHERMETDPEVADRVAALQAALPDQLVDDSPLWRVIDGRVRDVLIPEYGEATVDATGTTEGPVAELVRDLGIRSLVVVPLLARTGILGAVTLVGDADRPPLGEADLALVQDLAVRAGLMLENTQLFARERAAAATLQRSLLPRLPVIDGFTFAAEYVPAADQAAVGGDWYDVFALRGDHGVAVVVGDVMGHDIDSAARMGKLSTIVRSYGWPGSDPNVVLTAVDELLEGSDLEFLATCIYATVVRDEQGATLRYSSAGHPPAIVRDPDGVVSVVRGGRGPMLGVSQLLDRSARPADAVVSLPRGSILICFTDGLTDGFGDEPDLDEGLAEICRLTAELPLDAGPRRIIDTLTKGAVRHLDDVAVVAMRID
ncbi:PP2C family protein-serine/threonine phosphatase [Jatrophihabitans fulvus]